MKKDKRGFSRILPCLVLGIACMSACSQVQPTDDTAPKASNQEEQNAEEIAASPSAEIENSFKVQEPGQQNIVSDGEYLYTVHRQTDKTDLLQSFQVGEAGLEVLWRKTTDIGARISIEGGNFQVVHPEQETEAGNAAKKETAATEYPFGRDLNLVLEVQDSHQKTAKIKLQMIHPSTGERLQKLSFFVNNTDWTERISENIIVDHQHCYIGFGRQNQKEQHLYQLYHYSEEGGFRKLMEYNWGKSENPWESCGWIRGNDVYIFSPGGRKSIIYNVVSEEIISSGT